MLVWCTMGNSLASCAPSGARPRWAALLLLVACTSSGCATIGLLNPRSEDALLQTTKEQVPTPEGHFVAIKQAGTTVSITAKRACDVRESASVSRTTRAQRVNRSAALDWTFGGLGAGLAASGAVILVDSSKVYPNDSSARQYNPLGPTGARLVGASLAAAGVALATVALVDVARSSGEEVKTELVNVPGAFVERGVRCKGIPLAGAPVLVALPKEREALEAGVTGPDGRLAINLDAVVPADTVFRKDAHADVSVAGESAGKVELSGLYSARDEAEWVRLNRHSCAAPDASTSCSPVSRYLERYADGAHAQEARALLTEAEPRLAALRDEEAWSRSREALATCSQGKPEDVELVCTSGPLLVLEENGVECETSINQTVATHQALNDDNYGAQRSWVDCCSVKEGTPKGAFREACSSLRSYAKEFPKGQHAAEAAVAITKGDVALEKWRAARTKRRAQELAAADAEDRRTAALAKREADARKAEERRAEAAAKAEEHRLRAACHDDCGRQCVLRGYNPLWCVAECDSRCQ